MIIPAQTLREIQPVKPFREKTIYEGVSYGLSAAGYDVRVAQKLKFLNIAYHDVTFLLASTLEYFDMPDDVLGIVHDKSTWARRGIAVQNTVIEPGWNGYLTLEITFHEKGLLTIPEGVGIAQVVFHRLESATILPYRGKYQSQSFGPQEAISET